MGRLHQVIVIAHAIAGGVSLLSMWIPMFSRKGGRLHRRAGLVFAYSMAFVCITSFVTSGMRLAAEPAAPDAPLFLILVGLLAAASTLWGVRVLRQKKRTEKFRGVLEWSAALILIAAGVAGVLYGLSGTKVLFLVFGVLSAGVGWGFVQVMRGVPKTKWFWWYEHLGGMLVGCISALTAFLVVNWAYAPSVVRDAIPNIAVWVAPGVIGGAAITYLNKYYRRKLEGRDLSP